MLGWLLQRCCNLSTTKAGAYQGLPASACIIRWRLDTQCMAHLRLSATIAVPMSRPRDEALGLHDAVRQQQLSWDWSSLPVAGMAACRARLATAHG
jgi:hypothetical protein